MRWFLIGLLLALQQEPVNPFPNHEEPPKGWYCRPAASIEDIKSDAHACGCLGMTDDPMCGTEAEPPPVDSPHCKVYCHRDHCSCMTLCEQS
jgi:hypothetical protein